MNTNTPTYVGEHPHPQARSLAGAYIPVHFPPKAAQSITQPSGGPHKEAHVTAPHKNPHVPFKNLAHLHTDRRWPDTHQKSEPDTTPNWAWLSLWEQENPFPEGQHNRDEWFIQRRKMHDRVWVAYAFPQFRVFDWDDDEIAALRKVVREHVCGACGRTDDPGCVRLC